MKDNHFQRDVRSAKGRREGGAPDLGRVERMVDSEAGRKLTAVPGERRRSRAMRPGEEKKAAAQRALVTGWSIALVCIGLLVMTAAGIFYFKGGRGDEDFPRAGSSMALPPVKAEGGFGAFSTSGHEAPGSEEAVKRVKDALAVRDPQRLTEFVRTGGTGADEIVGFFEELEQVKGVRRSFQWMGSMNANGLQMEGVLVEYEAEGQTANRLALLTPDEHGVWKMDFPAFARQTVPAWQEVLEGKSDEIVARVYVSMDNYYNGVFRDREWLCFAVASPDQAQLFFGYCRRGSAQEKALVNVILNGPRAQRVVLKLRRVEGAEDRQFEIARVLAEDWVVSETALDETEQ